MILPPLLYLAQESPVFLLHPFRHTISAALLFVGLLACGGGGGGSTLAPPPPPSPAIITAQPTDQSVTAGITATFAVTATGAIGYQWQRSTDGGATFAGVGSATATSYTTPVTVVSDTGTKYRVVVAGASNSVTSSVVTLTVTAAVVAPSITVQPANQIITAGQNASFSVTAAGTSLAYRWQRSTDGGASFADEAGATSATLALTALSLANHGHQFRVVVSNSAGSLTSSAALLTVNAAPVAPSMTAQPANAAVVAPGTATFTAAASGTPTPTLQWQVSTNGGASFTNIAGATTGSYNTPATAVGDSGRQFRLVASNSAGTATSQAALLTVTAAVVVPRFAYVANSGDDTVSIYTVNATTGQLRHNGHAATGASPHCVTVDPSGRFAYVANWGSNSVSAYAINAQTGALTSVGALPAGTWPYAVTVDPSGRFAYVANEASFNISAYAIDGSTGVLTSVGPPVAAERDPRSVTVDPTGKFAYVANGSSHTVSAYAIDATTGALTSAGPAMATGSSPQSVTVDPTGKFAYVANNISNTVSAFTINASSGVLTSLGAAVATGSNPSSVAVDPSGKFAYVANLASHDVSAYTINATTGALTATGTVSVLPSSARSIAIDPSGKVAYVACEGYNTVAVFSINASTGALTAAGAISGRAGVFSIALAKGATPVTFTPKFVYAANHGSSDASAYRMDAATGALTSAGTVLTGALPSSITTDPRGRFAYVTKEQLFEGTPVTNVSAFSIDSGTGALASTGGPTGIASNPISVAVDPSGRFAYVANQASYNVTTYTIDATTGALTTLGSVNTGIDPWSVCVDPSGRFVYVANQGSNSVSAFSINSSTGALTEIDQNGTAAGTTVATGPTPFAISVDPSGRFAYVVNGGTGGYGSVSTYAIHGSTGALTSVGTAVAVGLSPRFLCVDPLGRFAYVANTNSHNVSAFTINPSTGALTGAGTPVGTGGSPLSISIDPSGRFACVANMASNTVSVHAIDPVTGALTSVPGSPFAAGTNPYSVTTTGDIQ